METVDTLEHAALPLESLIRWTSSILRSAQGQASFQVAGEAVSTEVLPLCLLCLTLVLCIALGLHLLCCASVLLSVCISFFMVTISDGAGFTCWCRLLLLMQC